jgi:hypothetical protein
MYSHFHYNGTIIFQDAVIEELGLYDSGIQSQYNYGLNFGRRTSRFWWPGSATAREAFDVSND